jgi:Mn-dependent DtxR family transcriptional regulator
VNHPVSFATAELMVNCRVVEGGHFFTNCGDKVLKAIDTIRALGNHPTPKDVVLHTKEAPSSVRSALLRLKSKGLIEKRGACFHLTDAGKNRLKEIN